MKDGTDLKTCLFHVITVSLIAYGGDLLEQNLSPGGKFQAI